LTRDYISAWAAQSRRDGQSLNAMAVELLECAFDAYNQVEAYSNESVDVLGDPGFVVLKKGQERFV
jgi:hypothetical protein